MKKRGVIGLGVLMCFFMLMGMSHAAMVNHFLPKGEPQETVTVDASNGGLQGNWYFGVYDFNGQMSQGKLLLQGDSMLRAQFHVRWDGNQNQYVLTVDTGVNAGEELTLGDTKDFSFFFFDGTTYYQPDCITHNNNEPYSYFFALNAIGNTPRQIVQGNDIQAVPAPRSVLLLLSGMLGLIGFVRRSDEMKKVLMILIGCLILVSPAIATAVVADDSNWFVPRYPADQDDVDVSYNAGWNGLQQGWDFGVYDYNGQPSNGIILLSGGNNNEGASFIVKDIGNGNYQLEVTAGPSGIIGQTLNLGDTPDFSFFMKNGNTYYTDLAIKELGSDMYKFWYSSSNLWSGYVTGFDLLQKHPGGGNVPIPSSLLLLFSGIGGTFFFRRRKEA